MSTSRPITAAPIDGEVAHPPAAADHQRSAARRTRMADGRLRVVLLANAATSTAAGLVAILAADWCVEELGLGDAGVVRLVGAGLVLFGIGVAAAASTPARRRRWTPWISLADAAWVVLSGFVIVVGDLTALGRVVMAMQALAVLDFAVLQWWLHRRGAPSA